MSKPRSLNGLMLLGLCLVALPLLIAVVNAAIQIRSLAAQSETLVVQGVKTTRYNQLLFEQIASLERSARLYQVIANRELLDVYRQNHERFLETLEALGKLKQDLRSAAQLQMLRTESLAIRQTLGTTLPGSPEQLQAVGNFSRLWETATELADDSRHQIDQHLETLQRATARAQRSLFWQSAALIPGTLVLTLVFTLLLARPIRQIDRVINELGRGTFSRPIKVSGPSDLEALGRQLEWLRTRLLDLAQEKNRFLRHMSHELKTPLANIREGTELLLDGSVGKLAADQREVTAILRENGMKLQRLIENLLSFSAWQARSVGMEVSEFKLRPLIKNVLEAQQLTLVSLRVRLDVQVDDLTIAADRGKLKLILDNLLSNAIKFTPQGGTIHIHAKSARDQLLLDIADTGPGIALEERSRIFEAFYQGKTPQGGHVKGTGIGLSVVIEFVHAHGGTIEIVDGEFGGAHFRIRLPLRQPVLAARESADAA
ncbi:MAG TPA: HAMP domain-containing sensor histidine kinase [Steroidobacteraceae bacterium]